MKLGRFAVIRLLGRGSQGAVYLARDPDLERLVAIKLNSEIPGLTDEQGEVSPQARNLAQLRHPNIVALYETGRFHNLRYLVFEHLEGAVLRQETDCGPMAVGLACSTMVQIVDAIAYAHAKGILHLDLNPNNIMRDAEGKPRVMDFDLSRSVGEKVATDRVAGTLSYMAPEYFDGPGVDARTDVYALGQIFYELLTGNRAVPVSTREKMVEAIRASDPDLAALQSIDPGGHLGAVIAKATHKNPQDRYANAREMHVALCAAWERVRDEAGEKTAVLHGTLSFVLKRIERRGDFPAISRTLAEVNQLTSGERDSPLSRLAAVVLRDYALTSRLLKLANSSYFSRGTGRVKSVSDAISVMGVEQVRLTCNGLACFGHFSGKKDRQRLRDESVAAFITGLIARHVAAQFKAKDPEGAFLAGMLRNLGRMLALYYFDDDFEEIERLVEGGATEEEASRTVLGVSLAELGSAVGGVWGLPPVVVACMADTGAGSGDARVVLSAVRLADTLASVDVARDTDHSRLLAAAAALPVAQPPGLEALHALLAAAVEKFRVFAPALEVDLAGSACVQRLQSWLDHESAKAPEQNGQAHPPVAA